jgi:uncharacterized membrane protein YgdD (TMEM256/DUF423 family)
MMAKTDSNPFLLMGAVFAGIAVGAGAFGAHSLKGHLDAPMLAVFETAARYQMYHALALCIVARSIERYPQGRFITVGWLFTIGIVLFAGSLFVLSLTGIRWLGALTPLGGAAFIAGWAFFAWETWKLSSRE